jgi:hypothetical protein
MKCDTENINLIGKHRDPAYYLPKSSPLDRNIKCSYCAATFREETAAFFKAKHEREFHNEQT